MNTVQTVGTDFGTGETLAPVLALPHTSCRQDLTMSPRLECSGAIIAHDLDFLRSNTRSHHVAQADLKLLASRNLHASASQREQVPEAPEAMPLLCLHPGVTLNSSLISSVPLSIDGNR
ncbi:hypothetical protein AAY473_004288 [Plecturocebus cupreus]